MNNENEVFAKRYETEMGIIEACERLKGTVQIIPDSLTQSQLEDILEALSNAESIITKRED